VDLATPRGDADAWRARRPDGGQPNPGSRADVVQPGGVIRIVPTQIRLLNTAAPGTNLAAVSTLVTLHGAGSFPWPFIIPMSPN